MAMLSLLSARAVTRGWSVTPRALLSSGVRAFSTSSPPPQTAVCSALPKQTHVAVALFDGSCPLCAREIAFLRTFSRASRVSFVDVSSDTFDDSLFFATAGVPPIARATLLDEMHVVDVPAGVVRSRVPAFHTLYSALGYNVLGFTARPPFDAIADQVYEFIRNHKWRVAWLAK